jgi:outer membrane protein assembly factor BamE
MPNVMPKVNFPYKIDIQQGNVVTQEMVSKLKPGMTKSQVRYIMGTPLVTDVFHANRWDYVYTLQKAGKLTEERRITVIFDQDALQRVEGDVVPAPFRESQTAPSESKPEVTPIRDSQAPMQERKLDDSGDAKPEPAPEKTKAEAAPEKAKPEQGAATDEEEKGFFGRMLEKVGL